MEQQVSTAATGIRLPIPRWEFIALAAALMALNALAIDIMLPGLQQIGASLGEEDENARQYVISAYIVGFGAAQLFFGPLSDRFGRRAPLLIGLVIYVVAAFASGFAPNFWTLLALRFVQGIGAAGTRVITVSVVRDLFGGRAMAEILALVFMVFMAIPVVAPAVGQLVMAFSDWPMIFVFMGVMSLAITGWTFARLPETLHPEYRRPFTLASVSEAFRITLTNRLSLFYTLAATFIFGALFGFINSVQQIYVDIYGLGDWFAVLFAIGAGLMAVSSFTNSRLVGRFGMRRLSHGALIGFTIVNALWLVLALAGPIPFWLFFVLFSVSMFQFGWIGSNFNTIAMEELGHVAGTASSAQGFVTTLGGGVIGAMIGQAYDGTLVPLAAGYFLVAAAAVVLVLIGEKGRLFRAHNPAIG